MMLLMPSIFLLLAVEPMLDQAFDPAMINYSHPDTVYSKSHPRKLAHTLYGGLYGHDWPGGTTWSRSFTSGCMKDGFTVCFHDYYSACPYGYTCQV